MASKRPDAADPLEGDVGMPSTDAHDVVDSEAEALQPARRLGFVDRFLFFPSLPRYTGQHRVGTIDIEVPVDRPRGISGLKRIDGSDALRIDSVLMTIFYPTEAKSGKRLPWLKQPKVATATGYANFANFSRWLVVPLALLVAGLARLPAFLHAPLLRANKGKRRLVVFSHGLAGSRTAYSQYCGELASRGYVVAAIEHRDGSGPSTFSHTVDGKKRLVPFYRETDISKETRMPAIEMRKHEVEMRAEEVHEAIVAVRSLVASGHPPTTLLPAGRTPATAKMDWSSWKDAISVDEDVVLAGHSFGGATVVHSLRALPSASLDAVSHGVVLDPWVEPLPSSSVRDLPRALLAINSPGFTRWSGNFSTLSSLVSSASGPSGGLATLGGSVHTSFSDFPTLFPRLSRLSKGGPTIDPRRAIGICVDASVAFIEGRQSVLADGERVDRVSGDKAQLSEPGKLYVHVPPAL